MDADRLQPQDIHSPRQKFELTAQLAHFETAQQNHFHFQAEDNPFSYYNEVNEGNLVSSEDEAVEEHADQKQSLAKTEDNRNIIQNVNAVHENGEVPQIINSKATEATEPILPLVKQEIIEPISNIQFLKETEFDLSKLPKIQPNINIDSSPNAEKKYQQQLASDLQNLKNSLKGKEAKNKGRVFQSNKQESPPRVNLNKTYAPLAKYLNESEMQLQQMRMLIKMAFQKKKANYEMLKEWDRKRAENMALHGKTIELLQNQIDLRIKSSLENFQNYQTFFKQKARQEEKYVSSPVINTRYALQNNSLSKNVYINCSVILNTLCDQNTGRCKKINDFIHLIRTNILKELTQTHLSSSQRELLKVREKISTLKSSLKRYNAETEEKTIELGNLFKEQAHNITNKCEKDFYRTQLSFLRKAIQQTQVQKKLGEYCLEYYHTAVQEELKRSSIIREAMVTYSRGLKETYNLEIQCPQMEQMSKNQQLKLIEEYFSLEEMFDQRTIELLKIRNSIEGDITIDVFNKYISGFNYQLFDSRIILLKEFEVKWITHNKSKEVSEENCYLAITVDNFLHLSFSSGRNACSKPDVTIKIAQKWLEVRGTKDQFIDIVKKEEKRNSMMSYFWDNKIQRVYRVKFSKRDNKEQFLDYITKLMIDSY